MKKNELLILGWHQVYLTANAGGYVRLKEFVKHIPKEISVTLLDNKPTLFKETVSDLELIVYDTPKIHNFLQAKFFLLWLLFETIIAGFFVYKTANDLIKKRDYKAIYVPIGEFPQLYLPGILLKKKHPDIKLIVDILNFELPEKNSGAYFQKLRKSGVSFFRAGTTIVMFYIGYLLTAGTLKSADFVFTVSPNLVKKIKKVYKKNTIDFTPSGVNSAFVIKYKTKKYQAVYVGRITIQKGIIDLLDVWSKVVLRKKDALLGIVGHIDHSLYEEIKDDLKKRRLERNVIFLGQVTDREKFKILSESEIFLHLARYEPLFPVIGILEGLASGLYTIFYNMPVVTSQVQQLKKEKSLAIIKNGDTMGVSDKVIEYLSLLQKDKIILSNQAQKFAKRYEWNTIARKEFDVIKQLMN